MPSLLKAAVLGVLQGLTEFLPVSSTAHLLIASRLIGFEDPGGVFTIMIQLGSILAMMWLYRQKIVHVVATLSSDPDSRNFALSVIVATIPALVAGALLSSFVKRVLYASFGVIGAAFLVGGVVMLVVERLRPAPDVVDAGRVPAGRALAVGFGQTLALIPGVRSGGTIVAAMLPGIDVPRRPSSRFSRDADDDGRVRAGCWTRVTTWSPAAAKSRRWLRERFSPGCWSKPFLHLSGGRGSRRSPVLDCASIVLLVLAAGRRNDMMAPPQLHRRLLRDGAGVHQRGGAVWLFSVVDGAYDAALRSAARPAHRDWAPLRPWWSSSWSARSRAM
jgi:undecaprenyl-diphosphatase